MLKVYQINRMANLWRCACFWGDWNSDHYDIRRARKALDILQKAQKLYVRDSNE